MIEKEKIKELLLPEIEKGNLTLVDFQVKSGNLIKITLDSISGVTIDECVKISKLIEGNFDREIEDFEIEVSSYGISLPFILPLHFQKNLNKSVEIFLKGSKIMRGILKSFECEGDKLKNIDVLIKKKVQLEGKKKKTEIEEIIKYSDDEIQKVRLFLDF